MKIFCGKCGSRAYPEGGIGIRDNSSIACFPCGNRTPSKYGFKKEDGSWLIRPIGEGQGKEGEEMGRYKKETCGNCERPDVTIVSGDLCWTCSSAARGKKGEEREEALALIKRHIQNGEIKPRGLGNKKPAKVEEKASAIPEDGATASGSAHSRTAKVEEKAKTAPAREQKPARAKTEANEELLPAPVRIKGETEAQKFLRVFAKKMNRTPEEQILHWIMLEMDGVKDARF